MKICTLLVIAAILCSPALTAELTYNFSYTFQGHTRGRFLLIFPFRVFYESSASVDFSARKGKDANLEFYFKGIDRTGYMMRTSGFSGKTVVVLTADYDLDKAALFGKKKEADFDQAAPYYTRYVKRKKQFLFKILPTNPDSIRFTRTWQGIHHNCSGRMVVRFKYHPEKLNICFNIYKILTELLKAYNHSFLAEKQGSLTGLSINQEWYSPALDYSANLNTVGGLAAKIVKKYVRFKQAHTFKMRYRVIAVNDESIHIQGEAQPQVTVWHNFKITFIKRTVKIRAADGFPLEDSFHVELRDEKGRGLLAKSTLRLVDQHSPPSLFPQD